eukprot:TRINITY_DN5466_c0_g1_i1.p1 TRINITY_DN5466_c0_g1~~TRINITY_DN5466_c0_g1_i1.p1  ORF type:complete len:196 (-),score=62.87 TRINITY_DN5466_c0_g1_i1:53-592(-)
MASRTVEWSTTCPKCKTQVADGGEQLVFGPMHSKWHARCFTCAGCAVPIYRFAAESEHAFYFHIDEGGQLYCLPCRNRRMGLPERVKVSTADAPHAEWHCGCQGVGVCDIVRAINERGALTKKEVQCNSYAAGGRPPGVPVRDNCWGDCVDQWFSENVEQLLTKAAGGNPLLLAKIKSP